MLNLIILLFLFLLVVYFLSPTVRKMVHDQVLMPIFKPLYGEHPRRRFHNPEGLGKKEESNPSFGATSSAQETGPWIEQLRTLKDENRILKQRLARCEERLQESIDKLERLNHSVTSLLQQRTQRQSVVTPSPRESASQKPIPQENAPQKSSVIVNRKAYAMGASHRDPFGFTPDDWVRQPEKGYSIYVMTILEPNLAKFTILEEARKTVFNAITFFKETIEYRAETPDPTRFTITSGRLRLSNGIWHVEQRILITGHN